MRLYFLSCAIALAIIAAAAGLTYLTGSSAWIAGFWMPGVLLAALMFSQGIHSAHAIAYFAIAVLTDVLFLGLIVMLVWKAVRRAKCVIGATGKAM